MLISIYARCSSWSCGTIKVCESHYFTVHIVDSSIRPAEDLGRAAQLTKALSLKKDRVRQFL